MIFYGKAFLASNSGDLILIQAELQVDDPMAVRACQMVVMTATPAQAEIVRPIGEVNPVQNLHAHELLDGPIHGCTPDSGVGPVKPLQQILG